MMNRRTLLEAISRHEAAYRDAYPKSAAHMAMDNHCTESTVYRALNRVRDYVQLLEIQDRWKPLLDHIMEQSPNFGDCDAQGILDMLYEVCDLCRNHQRTGFGEGIKLGIRLGEELRS